MKRLMLIIFALPLLTGISPFKGPTDLGNEAYRKGDYNEALRQYEDAAKGRPDSAEAHYNLGNAYYRMGEYDKALSEYSEAAKLDPKMADAFYNAGDSLFRTKRYEDALKSYERAKGVYGKSDPDTEHNIEVTTRLIEKKKEEQKKKQEQGSKDESKGGQQKQQRQGGQGQTGQPKQPSGGEKQAGPPRMSNEELKALLDRQADEEKKLRNYFRPGERDDDRGRDDEIEQMLRGMGFGPLERVPRPGEPYVERDW